MKKFRGFTLTEVLITLAIIGIVAAITLPSLLVNVNEKAWDAQRKALHARMAQAIGQMNGLAGYGTYTKGETDENTVDTVAESFIIEALSKVYKINNVCGPDKLSSCGIPSNITILGGASGINFPTKMSELNTVLLQDIGTVGSSYGSNADTKAAAFETINGESIAVFYNPYCGNDTTENHFVQSKMCANFIYDLNGTEGPNQVGKDIGFMTAFYNKNSVLVSPDISEKYTTGRSYTGDSTTSDAAAICKEQEENLRLPDRDEAASIFVNSVLANTKSDTADMWTGSIISTGDTGLAWRQSNNGFRGKTPRTQILYVHCISK